MVPEEPEVLPNESVPEEDEQGHLVLPEFDLENEEKEMENLIFQNDKVIN